MHHPRSLAQLVDAFDSIDWMLLGFVLLGTILFAVNIGKKALNATDLRRFAGCCMLPFT
jgi:hypothetical protein